MKLYIFLLSAGLSLYAEGQQKLTLRISDKGNKIPVAANIHIKETGKGLAADSLGMASIYFLNNGSFTLHISAINYSQARIKVLIPHRVDTLEIRLEGEEHEIEEIIIQSTRTSRTIPNVPTRVETIELEEIDEKNNMRPANVAMLLHESTGIQVQQTSATSANASIRIQGLDGRYTQLLKDGFPNYGNFSGGLSVLEIPPLDLKQVEIIKGPASPLYGGGAIAGVVNFISKTPKLTPEYNFIINYSNIGQANIGGFASQRGKKAGYSLLALYSRQRTFDVDDDDFTEVPKANELTIHPKLFLYPDHRTVIQLSNSFTRGVRTGGDIFVVNGKSDAMHQYFEENKTIRNTTTIELDKQTGERNRLLARQSFSVFDRGINMASYRFSGVSYNSFTDISFVANAKNHALVLGANFIYDKFREKNAGANGRDNLLTTGGVYGQHTWDASGKIKLESGLRFDLAHYSNSVYKKTELFFLPRISLLVKFNSKLSSRIGAGMGYKTPTLFTEATETIQYRGVGQLSHVESEKSYGGTADINLRTNLANQLSFSLNHMFFYTAIKKPLVLTAGSPGSAYFMNSSEPVTSAGFETNARFVYKKNLKLFLGYTFTHAKAGYLPGKQLLPLVPKSKFNCALVYEKEAVFKMGLEGYFTGQQYLSDGTKTPSFKDLGFMAEKIFKGFSLYVNFENFTDTRQSRYKNVVNGSHLDPAFDEIWTHTEGFVMNGGVKIKL